MRVGRTAGIVALAIGVSGAWGIAPGPAAAHEIHHMVTTETATTVRLDDADGRPFAGEPYEILAPDGETPFQTGTTDAQGRLAFLPDRSGAWRVRVHGHDGHGIDINLRVGEDGVVAEAERPAGERTMRFALIALLAVGILFVLTRLGPRNA